MIRSIKRNILKKELGTNKISDEWHRLKQKELCGYKWYKPMIKRMKKHKNGR